MLCVYHCISHRNRGDRQHDHHSSNNLTPAVLLDDETTQLRLLLLQRRKHWRIPERRIRKQLHAAQRRDSEHQSTTSTNPEQEDHWTTPGDLIPPGIRDGADHQTDDHSHGVDCQSSSSFTVQSSPDCRGFLPRKTRGAWKRIRRMFRSSKTSDGTDDACNITPITTTSTTIITPSTGNTEQATSPFWADRRNPSSLRGNRIMDDGILTSTTKDNTKITPTNLWPITDDLMVTESNPRLAAAEYYQCRRRHAPTNNETGVPPLEYVVTTTTACDSPMTGGKDETTNDPSNGTSHPEQCYWDDNDGKKSGGLCEPCEGCILL